jgi:hypothetical protein
MRRRASNDEFHMATSADDPYASMRRRAMIHEFHLGTLGLYLVSEAFEA